MKLCEEIEIKDYEGKKRKQAVEYEWRPKYSEKCKKVGHVCNIENKPTVKVWKPKADNKGNEDESNHMLENVQIPVVEALGVKSPRGSIENHDEEEGP